MPAWRIILAGLAALTLAGVGHAGPIARATPSAEVAPRVEPSDCPLTDPEGQLWRPAAELDSVKAWPGIAAWDGCTLTLSSNGRPLATFTDLPVGGWHFLGFVDLTEKDGTQRRAYLLMFSTYETHCTVLLDPDGRMHVVSLETFKPVFLPGGRLIASGLIGSGGANDRFMIVDWAERKAYLSPEGCQVVEVKAENDLNLACWHRTDRDVGYYADAHREADGRWRITPIAGFKGYLIPQYLADRLETMPAPLQPSDRATTLEPSPIPDDTDGFARMGFAWLGKPPAAS